MSGSLNVIPISAQNNYNYNLWLKVVTVLKLQSVSFWVKVNKYQLWASILKWSYFAYFSRSLFCFLHAK